MQIFNSLEEIIKGEKLDNNRTYDKIVFIPDYHGSYEDYRALHGVYRFINDFKPDQVIMLGDHVDFYALSKFDKNPDRIKTLQKEIDVLHYHLKELRKVHPNPKSIIYLRGNHEYRLIKYLWKNPEIISLRNINNIEGLLELKKFNVDYKLNYNLHGLLIKHGDIVRKHSGYTAKSEFDNEGTSGISAHSHRLSSHYITNRSGSHAWYEMGHLCDESAAEYMEGKIPNWQKGFGYMIYNRRKRIWSVVQIPIIDNAFIAFEKTYEWSPNIRYVERQKLK